MFEAAMGGSGGAGFSSSELFCPWVVDHVGQRFMHVDTGEFVSFEEVGISVSSNGGSSGVAVNSLDRFSNSGECVIFNPGDSRSSSGYSNTKVSFYHTQSLRLLGEVALSAAQGSFRGMIVNVRVSDDGTSVAIISDRDNPNKTGRFIYLSIWQNWELKASFTLTENSHGATNDGTPKVLEHNGKWVMLTPDDIDISPRPKGAWFRVYGFDGVMESEIYIKEDKGWSYGPRPLDAQVINGVPYFSVDFYSSGMIMFRVNNDFSLTRLSGAENDAIINVWRLPTRGRANYYDGVVFSNFKGSPEGMTLPFPVFGLQLTDEPMYVLPLSKNYRSGVDQARYFIVDGVATTGQKGVFTRAGEPVITGKGFSTSGGDSSQSDVGLPILWRQ